MLRSSNTLSLNVLRQTPSRHKKGPGITTYQAYTPHWIQQDSSCPSVILWPLIPWLGYPTHLKGLKGPQSKPHYSHFFTLGPIRYPNGLSSFFSIEIAMNSMNHGIYLAPLAPRRCEKAGQAEPQLLGGTLQAALLGVQGLGWDGVLRLLRPGHEILNHGMELGQASGICQKSEPTTVARLYHDLTIFVEPNEHKSRIITVCISWYQRNW